MSDFGTMYPDLTLDLLLIDTNVDLLAERVDTLLINYYQYYARTIATERP